MKNTRNRLSIRTPRSAQAALKTILAGVIGLSACAVESDSALLADADSEGEVSGDDGTESSEGGAVEVGLGEANTELGEFSVEMEMEDGRYCTYSNDCIGSCECTNNQCVWPPIGPVPPLGFCDQAPQRSCSDASDCQNSCLCLGGTCVQGPLPSPLPPPELMPRCHLPPPDSYEYDDMWSNWSAYVGAPQAHSFHDAGDRDWVAVYFATGGDVRFETYGLEYGADTKIKVFEFNNLVLEKGALVGINDDIGGPWWVADSKSSRVDITVPDDSTYLIKIINKSDPGIYTTSTQFPEYNFEISYN